MSEGGEFTTNKISPHSIQVYPPPKNQLLDWTPAIYFTIVYSSQDLSSKYPMRINIPKNRKKRIIIGNAIIPSTIKAINPHKVSSSPHLEQSFKLQRGLQSGCMMKQMHKRMMTATIPLTTMAAPTPA